MIGYSIVAIIAAYMNRQNDEPQSMALDDLNDHSTNPSANTHAVSNNENNFPSTRLGARTTATSHANSSAQEALSLGRKTETVDDREQSEQEAHVNPFSDPRNIIR